MEKEGSEPSEVVEKTGGVLPEVFFDIIARVIPGTILLWLYCSNLIKPQSVLEVTGSLVAAYLIGFTLDVNLSLILEWMGKKKFFQCLDLDNSQRKKWVRGLQSFDRNLATKMIGEEIMFRSIMAISKIIVFFESPDVELLQKFQICPKVHSMCVFILSLFGYLKIRNGLNDWMSTDISDTPKP